MNDYDGVGRYVVWGTLTSLVFLVAGNAWGAEDLVATSLAEFPRDLNSYNDEHLSLVSRLIYRVQIEPFNLAAFLIFTLAVWHTFLSTKITTLSHLVQHRYSQKRVQLGLADSDQSEVSFFAKLLHFLGEIEAIFGIWVLVLITAIVWFHDWSTAVNYVNGTVNYTEPMFVVVIMTIASTRPVLNLAEDLLRFFARLGGSTVAAWWLTILIVGPILGSFITEPAAMTISALLLSKQFYKMKPTDTFKYATLGLLFVNISVGGTLTNFAAPPILMVAGPWEWSTLFMMTHFGWKACIGIVVSTLAYFMIFRKQFGQLEAYRLDQKSKAVELVAQTEPAKIPWWVTAVHLGFLAWTVINAHYPAMFVGGFLFFLGFKEMTPQFQNRLELKTAILVGFFLAGLVNHGGVQGWWISPVLTSLGEVPLMLMATGLTAFNDNAAITYLSTLVDGLSMELKYAVVVGAVTGGGLTVIANAPNPAGQAILCRFFTNRSVSPLYLALGALFPTLVVGLLFMLL